jgi:hypothetical protein
MSVGTLIALITAMPIPYDELSCLGHIIFDFCTIVSWSVILCQPLSFEPNKYFKVRILLISRFVTRVRIHNTSFSSKLTIWPNKLECLALVIILTCLVLWNSLAYWADSWVTKKMECCEYGTRAQCYKI